MKINDCYKCGSKMTDEFVTNVIGCELRNKKLERPYFVLKCTRCRARSMSFFYDDKSYLRERVINHWNSSRKHYVGYFRRMMKIGGTIL